MSENELSELDKLMLAIETDQNNDQTSSKCSKVKEIELTPLEKLMLAVNPPETSTKLNEDELFLGKIAANDLKVLENPPQSFKKFDQKSASTSPKKPAKFQKLSLIHSGDTDSSDDESNRNFDQLNPSGRDIKHLLAATTESTSRTWQPKREIKAIPPGKFGLPPLTSKSPGMNMLKAGINILKPDENIYKDPFFGIRISKPLISSVVLEERMSGRAAVSMFRVKNFIAQNGHTQDWVIAGCIVQKTNAKTSQSGNQYIIWTLSDLQNDLQSVSMFLFKNAFKELWKTTVGTVVGVLNPSILDNREGSRHQATLSVDNHQKVMIFGHSKDFGTCKSRKKDGEPCTAFVNTYRCSFCLYHVKQEYQKCALRSDCQSISGGLTALRNKVLGKNEVFYAGKSYMAIPAQKSKRLREKDNRRLSDLFNKDSTNSVPIQRKKKMAASSLEVTRGQRLKDLQLLKKLNGSKDLESGLDKRTNCDLDDVSESVTMEESRRKALELIAKLRQTPETSLKTDEKLPSTSTLEETRRKDLELVAKLKEILETSEINPKTDEKHSQIDLNLPSTSTSKTPDDKLFKNRVEGPIDVKQMNPKTNEKLSQIDLNLPSTSTSTSKSPDDKIFKNLLEGSSGPSEFNPKTNEKLSQIDLNLPSTSSLKTPEDKLKLFKNRLEGPSPNRTKLKQTSETNEKLSQIDLNLPSTSTSTSKSPDDKIFKNRFEEPTPKLSKSAVIDLNSSSNRAKFQKTSEMSEFNPKTSEKFSQIDLNLPSTSTSTSKPPDDKIFKNWLEGPSPKLSKNALIDLNSSSNHVKLKKTSETSEINPKTNLKHSQIDLNLPSTSTSKTHEDKLKIFKNRFEGPSPNRAKLKQTSEMKEKLSQIDLNLPSTSKLPSDKLFDGFDKSKLKIFKNLSEGPAPKLSQSSVIDLNSPFPNRAKLKALSWVQKNGPISRTNPSNSTKTGVKRFLEQTSENSESKKSKVEFSQRFHKIMAQTSAHADLLEQRDLQEQEKYFDKLEQREKMEEKMMTTFKVQCKAVKCLNCKYTSFSAAPHCKQEKHVLKVFDATKRFFKCGGCGNRTVSLDVCPMFSCKNCGGAKWERTTMMKEKIVKVGDGLSIRGGEQTFINSVVTDANINLLMPDD